MRHIRSTPAALALLILTIALGESIATALAQEHDGQQNGRERVEAMLMRQARRLAMRTQERFGVLPPLGELSDALQDRRELLARQTTLAFAREDGGEVPAPQTIPLGAHAHWIAFRASPQSASFGIDPERIRATLEVTGLAGVEAPLHGSVLGTSERDGLTRATIIGEVRSGYVIDMHDAAVRLGSALALGAPSVPVPLTYERGRVYQDAEHYWELLAIGRSVFNTSPAGRKANIRKAMNEHINGVIVQPGTDFSFNSTLGGPITKGNGWQDSLIIVNGRDLEPAPGGGICQAATTVYRAAILAGLSIVQRKSHSIYVSYYKKYGVGLDATVFPKRQDLVVRNDMANPIVLRAYTTSDDEAVVQVFGTPEERSVTMDGPYFAATAPSDLRVARGRKLAGNEIAWMRTVRYEDGREDRSVILSTYNLGIPKSLASEYADGRGTQELFAAAPVAF